MNDGAGTMDEAAGFAEAFHALTDKAPLPWQKRLYGEFLAGRIWEALDIPTGLGKTSVIAIWLIALAKQGLDGKVELPRRLVYVVDRRTVVDQSTDVAEGIRKKLDGDDAPEALGPVRDGLKRLSGESGKLLSISTLRGEHADNREWQEDPARAAIIVGTVDMIGSRLLFSGYGVSRKMRPFHAGLIGQDALIVHDEAHLSPAFGKLVKDIACIQRKAREPRPIKVLELSATQRGGDEKGETFRLCKDDLANDVVMRRLSSAKLLHLAGACRGDEHVRSLVDAAVKVATPPARVVIYVCTPDLARKVAEKLPKGQVAILTGTIRGYERDQMASRSIPLDGIKDESIRRRAKIFRGFRSDRDRSEPLAESEYLVATSAGEVGIDLDADHMVSDLSTLDSMIQRLGRVNRLGEGKATVRVIPAEDEKGEDSDLGKRIEATKLALEKLPPADGEESARQASPEALRKLVEQLGAGGVAECFAKMPRMVELTDILLDGWAMTSVKDLPGSPKVERWLHGVERQEPSLHVAWREEMAELERAEPAAIRELFEKHEILSREWVRGPLRQVVEELKKLVRRAGDVQAVIVPTFGDPRLSPLSALLDDEDELREATIVLPCSAGGLNRDGMLDGREATWVPDVADVVVTIGRGGAEKATPRQDRPERVRILLRQDPETESWTARPLARTDDWDLRTAVSEAFGLRAVARAVREAVPVMAEIGQIVLSTDSFGQEDEVLLLLTLAGSAETAQESTAAAARAQQLDEHNEWAGREAARIVGALWLEAPFAEAIVLAAANHDWGKDREPWQADIGNPRPRRSDPDWAPLAKSGRRGFVSHRAGRYRHEFGSLRQALANPAIMAHPECDLALHLIASHHGRARPHFDPDEWDIDLDVTDEENAAISAETLRRFTRLQRRLGRWGVAWLEALMRASDYAASERLDREAPRSSKRAPRVAAETDA